MLDHLIICVADYDASNHFYLKALEPLGFKTLLKSPKAVGFGIDGKPEFFIREADPVSSPVHIAFSSNDRETVDQFFAAALAAGGIDNGRPGLRSGYHSNYYAAFVFDPDGNNIEAVCHKSP